MDRPPLIVAPYDAELFGHWWYEGPQFLDYVLRKLHYDQQTVGCMTPAEYLRRFPENQHANPAGSSWGGDGTYEFWINDSNQDLIPRLHQAADRLSLDVRNRWPASASAEERCIQQMTRELMLAQASDWPFIMRTGTSPGYARKRVDDHLARFWLLAGMIDTREYDETVLQALMQVDSILPDIDPSWYA